MDYPFISAKCITYGRVDMLEESLYSFLNQDYPGNKEMIIVNDYPLQELVFDHPEVKIYNIKETFSTIGEKENYAASLCQGELIAQWDDDDIALPNHMQNIARLFTSNIKILHWETGIYYNEPKIEKITGIGNSGIVYRKSILEEIGGYPIENAGYDSTFVANIHKKYYNGGVLSAKMDDKDASWFYMWGGRGYHQSGQGTDRPGRPNIIQRHSAHIEQLRMLKKIPTGRIELKPNWKKDYKKMLEDHVRNKSVK